MEQYYGYIYMTINLINNKNYKGYYWSKEKSATTISEESTSGDKHHLEVQSLTSI